MPLSLRAARLRRFVAAADARILLLLSAAKPGRERQQEIVRLENLRGEALLRLRDAERG